MATCWCFTSHLTNMILSNWEVFSRKFWNHHLRMYTIWITYYVRVLTPTYYIWTLVVHFAVGKTSWERNEQRNTHLENAWRWITSWLGLFDRHQKERILKKPDWNNGWLSHFCVTCFFPCSASFRFCTHPRKNSHVEPKHGDVERWCSFQMAGFRVQNASFLLFVCLFVCFFLSFFLCLFLCLFVCLFVCFFVSLFLCFFVSLFFCLFVSFFLSLFLCLFVCL